MKLIQNVLRKGLPVMAKRVAFNVKATSLLRTNLPAQPLCVPRFFSSDAQSSLIEILAREEKEEKDSGNLKMPAELSDLKSSLESTWKIVVEGASVNLFLKDKKVQLSFHCQDTVEADPVYDDIENENDDDDEIVSPVRFCVTVSKADKTLVINCVSEYGEAKIEGVMTTTSTPDAIHANQGDVPDKGQYQGPDFLELSEDLQDAFVKYLEEECGVDSDVSAFVAMYTDYQEQAQYVTFLKDAQSIIS
jgi:Mitochondrial glycoprotein